MISGTFHPMSQQWRYFSREKSIIHTLHLAQLVDSRRGDTVAIVATAPTGSNIGAGQKISPLQLPPTPYFETNVQQVLNSSMVLTCFGSTNYLGQITAQNKMNIKVGNNIITMTPQEPGYFVVHVEGQSDLHSLNYQGPASDGQIEVQIFNGNVEVARSISRCFMVGGTAGHSIDSVLRAQCETIVLSSGQLISIGTNLGLAPVAYMSMWAFKIADP